MENHRSEYNIAAFVVGGILGASLVLLLNSENGKYFRSDLKLKTTNYVNKVRDNVNKLISNSRSSAELLKKQAEDIMDTVEQYARGSINKPVSMIEKEINGLKAAINAVKASYSLNPEFQETIVEEENITANVGIEDEILPKHLGMGKGRNRKSYS